MKWFEKAEDYILMFLCICWGILLIMILMFFFKIIIFDNIHKKQSKTEWVCIGTPLITYFCDKEKTYKGKKGLTEGDVSVGDKWKDSLCMGDEIYIDGITGIFTVASYGSHKSIDVFTHNLKLAKSGGAVRHRVFVKIPKVN